MGQLVPLLIFVAALGVVLGALSWLAARTRRRGVGMEVMGPVDQIYRPHTHEINRQIRIEEQRGVEISDSGQLKR